jgi:NADH-ubiquinone oxidoreductase chain 5
MLMVINITDFFFIMLGWDGLGLVSFFLIVFYQNYSSIYSGLFTVLINRVGDCFFIVSISFFLIISPYMWSSASQIPLFLLFLIVITFITKSAIYPFSPWLPLAIAAPTPISALVHSSTLVTAGLYLSMRFSFLLYSSSTLISFFLIVSVFTSFYAGLNAIFETDIKKLIALSTLSHLGFIGMAFSCGLLYLSFFHLIIHALFKSVLFISIFLLAHSLSLINSAIVPSSSSISSIVTPLGGVIISSIAFINSDKKLHQKIKSLGANNIPYYPNEYYRIKGWNG